MKQRHALSPVIATVILSGVVLAIGGAVWSYSLGAATSTADGYVNDTLSLVNEIVERFEVEHAQYHANHSLKIWIFNYGEADVTVDIYITANSTIEKQYYGKELSGGDVKAVTFDFTGDELSSGDDVVIKIHSRRQNDAYKTYIVP
ncbi:hypothetical protein JXL21_09525 [Candidatus Bathyarchaeota archaeon]|nr:hypothetical protein [Candidatus Bathyarchaeota archaeon]